MGNFLAYPWLLMLLAILPILGWLEWQTVQRRENALTTLVGVSAAQTLLRQRPSRLLPLVLALGLASLIVGLAGPRWGRDWNQSAAPGRDLVLILDLSRSMFAEAPSRVERACQLVDNLIETIRQRGGHRLALIAFAGKPRLLCPLTHDLDHIREVIDTLDRSVPDASLGNGTRIGAALQLAVESCVGRTSASTDILLFSDGDDPARDGEWQAGGDLARSVGIPVYCVGLGDPVQQHRIPLGKGWLLHDGKEVLTRLEESPLRAIARVTGGQVFLDRGHTLALGEQYLRLMISQRHDEDSPDALPVLRQRQHWFLFPAFLLLLLPLLLPWRGST